MSKQTKIGLAAVAVVAVVGVGAWGLMKPAAAPQSGSVQSAETKATPKASPSSSVAAAKSLSYAGVEGKTALELLKAKDATAQTKGEGANAFVTTINGYTASEAKKEYWAFYVNGKMSDVGAGAYVTKAGDQIEWKIATY
jgi:hypothetical protein